MARAEALRLGPFVGGMNTASDPTAVADSELVDCINFELDIDGSLVSRPPIVETTQFGAWNDRIVMIGRATFAGGKNYVIASTAVGTYAFDGTAWSVIKANLQSDVALQYGGYLWIVPKPGTSGTQPGGRWDGTTFVADANIPEGQAAIFHKGRMFVAPGVDASTNASRLRFTDPISSFTAFTWTGTNIIDVAPGDGQNLIDIEVFNDNLMLFKNDSTYILAYDIRPNDAIVRNINNNIGVTAQRCMVSYENSMFVFHEGKVYEVINYDFSRINYKVPFFYDSTVPAGVRREEVFLTLIGDRLIVRYFNRLYAYGLKTRTWTRWESQNVILNNVGPFIQFPTDSASSNAKYYAGSSLSAHNRFFVMQDGYDSITKEKILSGTLYDIICTIVTKNYDLADSHHYKKLMWWGADILTAGPIQAWANPITVNYMVRWQELHSLTWNDLHSRTWDVPFATPISIPTNTPNSTLPNRLFAKFLKTMRFRQVNFRLTLKNDGTTGQGPCRVFTLTAIIGSKQTVPKAVN